MSLINLNLSSNNDYCCTFNPGKRVLKAESLDDQTHQIEIVARKSLGFFEWAWNFIRTPFGKNEWVKINIDDSNAKKISVYLNIDSLRENMLYLSSEMKSLKKLCRSLALDLKNKLNDKTKLRVFIDFFPYSKNKNIQIDETSDIHPEMNINHLYDSFKNISPQTENISLQQLKELLSHIERHKAIWVKEMLENNQDRLYLRHNSKRLRTLRVESNGDVFIMLKIFIDDGTFKKVRLSIDVSNKKLVANVVGLVIRKQSVNGKIVDVDQRNNLVKDFTSWVVHKNVAKQGKILEYEHLKKGRAIKKMAVIMPYFNEKSLFHLIDSNRKFNSKQKKQIVLDCLKGLKAFHDNGLLHRDIKPENILVKSKQDKVTKTIKYTAKIGDFGFVTPLNDLKDYVGSPLYVAPEIWRDIELGLEKPSMTFAADCYAMGVSLGYFLGLDMKFQDQDRFLNCPRHGFTLDSPKKGVKGTPEFLICQLIQPRPENRITLEEAISLAEVINF